MDRRMRGERTQPRHLPDVASILQVEAEARGIPGPGSTQDDGPVVTEILLAGGTPTAPATGGQETEHDVIADFPASRIRPDLLDDSGALVAAADRVETNRQITGGYVVVR